LVLLFKEERFIKLKTAAFLEKAAPKTPIFGPIPKIQKYCPKFKVLWCPFLQVRFKRTCEKGTVYRLLKSPLFLEKSGQKTLRNGLLPLIEKQQNTYL